MIRSGSPPVFKAGFCDGVFPRRDCKHHCDLINTDETPPADQIPLRGPKFRRHPVVAPKQRAHPTRTPLLFGGHPPKL